MLSKISWSSFFLILLIAAAIYYAVIILQYYRLELLTVLLGRKNRIDTNPQQANQFLGSLGNAQVQPVNDATTVSELLEHIRTLLRISKDTCGSKEELIDYLRSLIGSFPEIEIEDRQQVNSFIQTQMVQYSMSISEEETASLWANGK